VSIRLDAFDRARHRQELRRYTDLELILSGRRLRHLIENEKNIVSPFGESPGAWKLQIEDAMAEWRTRQKSRQAGVGVCLCHAPGSRPLPEFIVAPNAIIGRTTLLYRKKPMVNRSATDSCRLHRCRIRQCALPSQARTEQSDRSDHRHVKTRLRFMQKTDFAHPTGTPTCPCLEQLTSCRLCSVHQEDPPSYKR